MSESRFHTEQFFGEIKLKKKTLNFLKSSSVVTEGSSIDYVN